MDIDISPSNGFSHLYDSMNNKISSVNPMVLIVLTVIILFYFIVFSYLAPVAGQALPTPKSNGMWLIEIIMWGLFVFLILINGLQYFFQIDVKTAVRNLVSGTPTVDVKIKQESKLLAKKGKNGLKGLENDLGLGNFSRNQVFNVSGNDYTYEEGKALCKAYGAKLATYSQIENAYKSGAEWCNYGWSADQMAYFPTQKSTLAEASKNKRT